MERASQWDIRINVPTNASLEATDSFFKTLNFGGATYGGAGEDPDDD